MIPRNFQKFNDKVESLNCDFFERIIHDGSELSEEIDEEWVEFERVLRKYNVYYCMLDKKISNFNKTILINSLRDYRERCLSKTSSEIQQQNNYESWRFIFFPNIALTN
jgi:hypothetical protein